MPPLPVRPSGAPARLCPLAPLAAAAGRVLWARSALIACALFAAAGLAVVDDYGVTSDELTQRDIAEWTAGYVLDGDASLLTNRLRTYGVAFEMPLLFAERALGLEDSRDIYLSRHVLTHLFFAASGFFCSLLAYRLTGSRALALFALLLFLLHPRLYAHSFFNSKDIPFLGMFMIALYLIHRAFRRDTLAAFVLCGAGVAILTNIRILGLMPFGAVLAMRALDLLFAQGWGERRRVLAGGALFALSWAAVLYATWPAMWRDPAGLLADSFAHMARYDTVAEELFRGEAFRSDDVPPAYIPVWFLITTPPLALLLGLAGAAAAARRTAARPLDALRNTEARFGLLLAGCIVLPVAAAIALGSNLYNGWRQMYFLYAPFCLLAAIGLRWLASSAPERARGWRFAVYALAGVGVAAALASIVRLHPQQQVYFNLLVDRETPQYLRTQYTMDYWHNPYREILDYLTGRYPDGDIVMNHTGNTRLILPREDRERIVESNDPVFYAHNSGNVSGSPPQVLYERKVYGNTIAFVTVVDVEREGGAVRGAFLDAYRTATAGEPAARSFFGVHLDGRTLTYAREPCSEADTEARFFLHVFPVDADDLPAGHRSSGFADLNFRLSDRGARVGDACMAIVELPGYGIAHIATGQFDAVRERWRAAFPFDPGAWPVRYASITAGEPAARSFFGVYLDGRTLTYARDSCSEADTEARFFLHAVPVDADDLPEERRAYGFEALDFAFGVRGLRHEGRCMAGVELPDYGVARVRTGQFADGERLWEAEFAVPGGG